MVTIQSLAEDAGLPLDRVLRLFAWLACPLSDDKVVPVRGGAAPPQRLRFREMGGLCRREHSSDSDQALVLSRDAPPLSNRGEGRVLL